MGNSYIYIHIKPGTDEIFYVGKGTGKRGFSKSHRSNWWKSIVKKYNGFETIIVEDGLSHEYAYELEVYWISQFKAWGFKLCNMTDGGEGCFGTSVSEERKKIMSKLYLGEGNPFYGKKHSEETKAKWKGRKTRKGDKHSEKTKEKLRNINLGKIVSEETKKKISEIVKGRIVSKETREKLRLLNQKIVLDTSTGIYYDSAKEASKLLCINYSTLRKNLQNNLTNLKYA